MQVNRQRWPSVTEVAFEEEGVVAEAVTEEVVEAEGAFIILYAVHSRPAVLHGMLCSSTLLNGAQQLHNSICIP